MTHLDSIKTVFSHVVTVCKEMGMLGVGKISLDGTKIKAAKKKLEEEKLEKINVTDNDAKIMKHKDGSLKPSYNGQTEFLLRGKDKAKVEFLIMC